MSTAQVDSRLIVPALPPRHVSRPRLLAALDEAADVPLVLLSAGPGTGKTVLLTDWVLRSEAPVAWLAPTAEDTSPRQFWRLFRSALRAGAVPEDSAPLVLVIDDAHVLTDPDVLDILDRLIRAGHPRLVLAARSDPLLPLHRYRLAGQVRELRARELAMTPPEIQQLLDAHGVTLPRPAFQTLATRTDGWAAGVRLSAMRMEGTEHPDEFVSELALDQGSIGEYLLAEVLDRQPEPLRRLLIETSFLDEVTGPLAEAITGMDGCADMLAGLARSNSFVVAQDAAGTRFRCHQLFAEILRCMLQRHAGKALPDLLRRAAASFERSGDLEKALYWAVKAGDQQHVASLLTRGSLVHAFVHRQDLASFGLHELPPLTTPESADAAQAAEFALAGSVLVAARADAETAARELECMKDLRSGEQPADPDLLVTSGLVEFILGMHAGDIQVVDAAADHLLRRNGHVSGCPAPGLPAAVLLAQASTHFWHGRHDDIDALLQGALAEAQRDGPSSLELEVLGMIAYVDSYRSRPRHADDAALRARALLGKLGNMNTPATLELADASRSLAGADFAATAQALQRTLLPDVVGSDPGHATALALAHASLLFWAGQVNDARTALHSALPRPHLPLLAAHRDVILADIEVALGRPHAALRLLQPHECGESAVLVAVPRARAFLALHDLDNAHNCIRSVLTAASAQLSRDVLVDAMLCDAQIAQLKGDPGRALEMIAGALDIAHGEIVPPFLRVTDLFAALLARHPAIAAQWPTPLASEPAAAIPEGGSPSAGDLPEPLTHREHAILRFLATSMTTAEIADELCLSVNTVKTHLAAIYRKLAACKRREAVLRARQLELILRRMPISSESPGG